nr:syntaxin-71-like isoform X2 [Ipomoea batatas]
MVLALPDRINSIPDGSSAPPKQSGGWGASGSRAEIKFDSDNELCFDLSQVDKATSDLKNTNVRLKDTVTQVNELHGLQCLYIFILFF